MKTAKATAGGSIAALGALATALAIDAGISTEVAGSIGVLASASAGWLATYWAPNA